jgi:hypothetical protein
MKEICEECNSKLEATPGIEVLWGIKMCLKIPFTNIKFVIIDDTPDYFCPGCAITKQDDHHRKMCEEAYISGYDDGQSTV